MDQLIQQMAQLRNKNQQLNNDLDNLRQRTQQRGRPGALPYRPDPDQYSIPRPPGWAPPGQGPVGDWDADELPAFLGVRLLLMKVPEPFEGEHDDMERFLRDCNTYFEVFCHQFQGVSLLMVVFATSLFIKCTRDWWTHCRDDYWVNDFQDPSRPQFRYPHWNDFILEFKRQFCDPAVEEVHERRLKEMKMGNDPAPSSSRNSRGRQNWWEEGMTPTSVGSWSLQYDRKSPGCTRP